MKINSELLRIQMAEQGSSIGKFAQNIGISRQTLSYILNGKSCNPITAGKIAKYLELNVKDIIKNDE